MFVSKRDTSQFFSRNNSLWMIEFSLTNLQGHWTHNHLVHKQILNQLAQLTSLAKWLSFLLRTKWLWVWFLLQSLSFHKSRLFRERISMTFRQSQSVDSLQTRMGHDKNTQSSTWFKYFNWKVCFRGRKTYLSV